MIITKIIPAAQQNDINLKNEPFPIWGRLIPSLKHGKWSARVLKLPEKQWTVMTFPNERYHYDQTQEKTIFVGAYQDENCVGLAVLQKAPFQYLYLADLKVRSKYRRQGIGRKLITTSIKIARQHHYRGLYTIGQDNNLSACLFYLKTGFVIGGFDNHVYRGTPQENKADIFFYHD